MWTRRLQSYATRASCGRAPVIDGGAVLGGREGCAPDVLHLRALQCHTHRRLLRVPLLERHLRSLDQLRSRAPPGLNTLQMAADPDMSSSASVFSASTLHGKQPVER